MKIALKFWETKIKDDHILKNDTYPILEFTDGQIVNKQAPALLSLNMRLRDDYTKDTAVSIKRWNRTLEEAKIKLYEWRDEIIPVSYTHLTLPTILLV